MGINLNPYLNFRGQAREAMEFYAAALGGELSTSTFADHGGMGVPAEEEGNVMHSQITVDGRLVLMGSDVPSHLEHAAPAGHAVSLSGDDEPRLRQWWERLSEGATIQEPLAVAPGGDAFGMLRDRFGVDWMINIAGVGGQAGEQAG